MNGHDGPPHGPAPVIDAPPIVAVSRTSRRRANECSTLRHPNVARIGCDASDIRVDFPGRGILGGNWMPVFVMTVEADDAEEARAGRGRIMMPPAEIDWQVRSAIRALLAQSLIDHPGRGAAEPRQSDAEASQRQVG